MKKGHPIPGAPASWNGGSAAVADRRGDLAHGGPLLNVVDPLVMIDVGARGCSQPEEGCGESGGDDAGNAELNVNDEALNVVNAPVLGTTLPIADGEFKVLLTKLVKPEPDTVPLQTKFDGVTTLATKVPL